MPGINGMGLSFNLPNFNGALYGLTPSDAPFTSAIGVLSGGGSPVYSKSFEWQTFDLRDVENPTHLEGQAAPQARNRVRMSVDNVCQIFHSQVSISYTKQAAMGQRNGLNNSQNDVSVNEMNFQVMAELKGLKRDLEHVFLNGEYAKPNDNTASRRTRGLLPAISTNVLSNLDPAKGVTASDTTDAVTSNAHGYEDGNRVVFSGLVGGAPLADGVTYFVRDKTTNTFKVAANAGGPAIDITTAATAGSVSRHGGLTEKAVIDLMQMVWESGGIQEQDSATLMCNAGVKRQLSKIFITDKNYTEETRNMAGVSVQTIETDFGKLNVMLNRYMPTGSLAVASLEVCKPRLLLIPGKGFLFLEPLAKVGASEQAQIYGEVGLEYGNERQHGKMTNINPAA